MSVFKEYDDVIREIGLFLRFERRFRQRLFSKNLIKLKFKEIKEKSSFPTICHPDYIREYYINRISNRLPDHQKTYYSNYIEILVSKYPREALCNFLNSRFPKVDFESINELHSTFNYRNPLGYFWKSLGSVFAIGLAVLNMVPETVVISMGFNYVNFEKSIFWLTTGVVVMVGIAVFQISRYHKKIIDKREYISYLLNQIVILRKAKNERRVVPFRQRIRHC